MSFKASRKLKIFVLLFLLPTVALCAKITNVKLGSHEGYSLLIIECDLNLAYSISSSGDQIFVSFPGGTKSVVSSSVLAGLKDSAIGNIDYNENTGKLVVTMKMNFELKTYANKYPFQLILDLTHKPGQPPASRKRTVESKPPPKEPAPSGETVKKKEEPVREAATDQAAKMPDVQDDEDYPELFKHFKTDNENYLNGLALKQKDDYQAALKEFVLAAPAVKTPAYYQTALMYRRLGKSSKAVREISLAIVEEPTNLYLRIELGRVYQEIGKESKAEDIWNEVLSMMNFDSTADLNEMSGQVRLLESLLSSEDMELAEEQDETGQGIPWLWMLIGAGGLAVVLAAVKIFLSKRKPGFMEYDEEEESAEEAFPGFEEESDELVAAEESIMQSIDDEYEDDEEQNIEKLMDDLKEMGVETDGLTDEKQQRIYELAKQNYSISEIARMLNMGQEEVKFILDFRTKTEDGTISLK